MEERNKSNQETTEETPFLRRRVQELESEIAALKDNDEKYRLLAEHFGDCLWMMDLATLRFTYVSPSVARIYGSTVEETMAKNISDVLPPESLALVTGILEEELALEATGTADPKRLRTIEIEEYMKDGSRVWIESVLSFLRDEQQHPISIVGVSREVTQRKRLTDELRNLAAIDPLTGAFNRRHFQEELQREMNRSNRFDYPFSLMMLDVDHFKEVNDRFGHEAGDRVLKDMTQMIRKRIRSTDILARWGGEEFLILLPNTTAQQAVKLVKDLLSLLQTKTFSGIGQVTASFGISGHKAGEGIDEFITRVDNLLYRAKHEGRSRFVCDFDAAVAT